MSRRGARPLQPGAHDRRLRRRLRAGAGRVAGSSGARLTLPIPVRVLAERAAETGIFLDFDGSLAPIVSDPAEARAISGASTVLSRLSGGFRVVAVVSGRSVRDLSHRL